jgi:tryptophan 2,3-dioxygenase
VSAAEPAAGCPFTGSAAVRTSSDQQREALAAHTGGQPWTEFPPGATPYAEYAEIETLLTLQHPRTDAVAEPAFIIISQVKELLFTLLHTELTTVRDRLAADRLGDALWTLRRADRGQRLLLTCWEVIAALSPPEFAAFRDILGVASGFQSRSYRKLEFLLGNKNPAMLAPHRHTAQYHEVEEQLRRPSVYDAALNLLARAGLPIPAEVLERDLATPYRPHAGVEQAWREIYLDPEKHRELFLLGEALTDTADQFARWRYVHLVVVQRMLGAKPGSGGTGGVSWLTRIAEHRFFPELWTVRSGL